MGLTYARPRSGAAGEGLPGNERLLENAEAAPSAAPSPPAQLDEAPEWFGAFVREHRTMLTSFARALGADPDEADDAVAEGLVALLRANQVQNPRAYVHGALRLIVAKRIRQNMRSRARDRNLLTPEPDESADRSLAEVEDAEWVKQIVWSLPPTQRQIFALFMDGLTPQEIATRTGRTITSVRSNLYLARSTLKSHPDIAEIRAGHQNNDR